MKNYGDVNMILADIREEVYNIKAKEISDSFYSFSSESLKSLKKDLISDFKNQNYSIIYSEFSVYSEFSENLLIQLLDYMLETFFWEIDYMHDCIVQLKILQVLLYRLKTLKGIGQITQSKAWVAIIDEEFEVGKIEDKKLSFMKKDLKNNSKNLNDYDQEDLKKLAIEVLKNLKCDDDYFSEKELKDDITLIKNLLDAYLGKYIWQ